MRLVESSRSQRAASEQPLWLNSKWKPHPIQNGYNVQLFSATLGVFDNSPAIKPLVSTQVLVRGADASIQPRVERASAEPWVRSYPAPAQPTQWATARSRPGTLAERPVALAAARLLWPAAHCVGWAGEPVPGLRWRSTLGFTPSACSVGSIRVLSNLCRYQWREPWATVISRLRRCIALCLT